MSELFSDISNSTPDMFGGLALLPFAVVFSLSALAFAQGWLDWETNGGPPFLGEVVAFLIFRYIQKNYYGRRLQYVFGPPDPQSNIKPQVTRVAMVIMVIFVAALFVAWYYDARAYWSIRLLPLVAGIPLLVLGEWHRRTEWRILSWGYLGAGGLSLLYGIIPSVLQVPINNNQFGLEGVWELITLSLAILIMSLAEHHTIKIILARRSDLR